ncbi:MAG TPA: response regulator [Myxococcaceae bacterium]|nr:response regulator [Myxococcaceae bacterium]
MVVQVPKRIEILMVEDSPSDVLITREALRGYKLINEMHVVEDGEEAMTFLRQQGKYAKAPRPDLVLLDWNLPRKSGKEVLEEVKSDEQLKLIPVVILTSSKAEVDILRAYGLHANAYITKPVNFDSFVEMVGSIGTFWFSVVTLPTT